MGNILRDISYIGNKLCFVFCLGFVFALHRMFQYDEQSAQYIKYGIFAAICLALLVQ